MFEINSDSSAVINTQNLWMISGEYDSAHHHAEYGNNSNGIQEDHNYYYKVLNEQDISRIFAPIVQPSFKGDVNMNNSLNVNGTVESGSLNVSNHSNLHDVSMQDLSAENTTLSSVNVVNNAQLNTVSGVALEISDSTSLNTLTVKLNKSSNGSGPLDLPPNVLSLAPAGLSLDKSQEGICPAYNK